MESFTLGSWAVPLLHHLWQATVFTGGVWLLTLALRRNAARVRYRLWMAASLKFLLPFSLLIAMGARLPWPEHLSKTQPEVAAVLQDVAQPLLQVERSETAASFVAARSVGPVEHRPTNWLPFLLLGVWAAGTLLLLGRWMKSWLALRAVVQRGEPMALADGTPALLVAENVEPGIFGILRPRLVLPRGIAERLSADQLDAVVAHELHHMRRKDNLTAALHMAVDAVFWFHPLVWWLQARLVEERERACDEAVVDTTRQPLAYAEGILNVCKFYAEAPLSCVSGVTGSELKQRIARILSGQGVRKLDLLRKALLALACVLALGTPLTLGLLHAAQAPTSAASAQEKGIAGTWQGTLHAPNGQNLRTVLKITKDDKGALHAMFFSIDQSGQGIATSSISFENGTLKYGIEMFSLAYEGKLSADGNSISGTSTQADHALPLVFERATPETEWAMPAPPPHIPPMAADANPSFEVSTIKPTKPDEQRTYITVHGTELVVVNFSLNNLIKFAYGVQDKQIVGAPAWMSTEKWDINAKPDTPGMPNDTQLKGMLRKLLADRFALKFHKDQREMAAYVLTVGKDGPKMKKNTSNPDGLPGLFFGPIGTLHVTNAKMEDFTNLMQSAVLDRPVLDKTGLDGRWDFTLKWTPDESQFTGVGWKVPPPPKDPAAAPPPLFTAIQEQLDLKLEAQKTQVPVLAIDHVDHPSPN